MRNVKSMKRTLFAAACALALAATLPASAQSLMVSESAPHRVILVPRDKSLSFRLDQPATRIVASQPEIAKLVATSDQSFYVQGIEFGSTNLLVYGPGGRLQQVIDVRVGYDAQGLQNDLALAFPREQIRVRNAGEGLILEGDVSDTGVASRAAKLAEKYAPEAVFSNLTVRASQEVVLEVRVLEVTRSALKDFGFSGTIGGPSGGITWGSGLIGNVPANGSLNLRAGSGHYSIDATLQALEEKGVIRTLARPNLVAVSGEKASFLAGGEFPYPVPQDLNKITLEFRTYGVKLDFQPTVQDNGLIRLAVTPEVSQLDNATALKIDNVTVPGLITRRANTTVELKDGASLAIGGLFERDYANDVKQYPLLGDIPVLGGLFRSSSWKRRESELVIIVTPRLATHADFDAARVAHQSGSEPNDLDIFLRGHSLDRPLARDKGTKK
jgi:pilus assembly protein CpaC